MDKTVFKILQKKNNKPKQNKNKNAYSKRKPFIRWRRTNLYYLNFQIVKRNVDV